MTEASRDRSYDPATLSAIFGFDAAHRRLESALRSVQRRSRAVLGLLLGYFVLGASGIAFLVFEARPGAGEGVRILAISVGWALFSVGLRQVYSTSLQQLHSFQEQLFALERDRGTLSIALSCGATGEALQMLRDWMMVRAHIPHTREGPNTTGVLSEDGHTKPDAAVSCRAPSMANVIPLVGYLRRQQRTHAISSEERVTEFPR